MAYFAYITKISDIRPHIDAHSLQIATILGANVVVGMDFKVGDSVCYFPCDGALSLEFAKVNKLLREDGGYFSANRRVITQRFRKEISDGFACKLELLANFDAEATAKLTVGDRINELGGKLLCEKYVTEATKRAVRAAGSGKGKKRNRGSTDTFPKHIDTEQLAYSLGALRKGDVLTITSKVHGTSHRVGYVLDEVELPWWKRAVNRFKPIFPTREYTLMGGSRNVILYNADDGLANKSMRDEVTAHFKGKLDKGELLFLELVGYDGETPIMGRHETKKLGDKEFTATYGEKMVYDYGCKPGQFDIYLYRVARTNEDGSLVDLTHDMVVRRAEELGLKVPHHYETLVYDGAQENLLNKVSIYADTQDPVGFHWQEGVCVRLNSSRWKCFKHKNNRFKILEGIMKDNSAYIDTEESA